MCLPAAAAALPYVGAGLSLGGSAANYFQASASASAQNRLNSKVAARNKELAFRSAADSYRAIGDKVVQEEARSGTELVGVMRDALEARARVKAAATGAGVKGASVDALLMDFERQQGEYSDVLKQNEQFVRAQAEAEKRGIRTGLESRLISTMPSKIQAPNLLTSALGAFSSALMTGLQIQSGLPKE
jgi:hypothetical protein